MKSNILPCSVLVPRAFDSQVFTVSNGAVVNGERASPCRAYCPRRALCEHEENRVISRYDAGPRMRGTASVLGLSPYTHAVCFHIRSCAQLARMLHVHMGFKWPQA